MKEKLMQHAEIIENADMTKHNTFQIGGNCKFLVFPYTISDLVEIIKYLKSNKVKYFIIGNGSNIVLGENISDLVVIKLTKLKAIDIHENLNMVYVESGAMLPTLANKTIEKGLCGLEFAVGIPGTVGGSIVGNAGAYNSCILDYVKSVTIINSNNEIETIEHENINYGYRTSMFKEKKDSIIVGAKLYLKKGDKLESEKIIKERRNRRQESQPLDYPSAGSVFRNPKGDSAWCLIDACGLKGYSIGGAKVSEKHANFIINFNNATSLDIYNLINYVHDEVLKKTKVDLKVEQEFIGWD